MVLFSSDEFRKIIQRLLVSFRSYGCFERGQLKNAYIYIYRYLIQTWDEIRTITSIFRSEYSWTRDTKTNSFRTWSCQETNKSLLSFDSFDHVFTFTHLYFFLSLFFHFMLHFIFNYYPHTSHTHTHSITLSYADRANLEGTCMANIIPFNWMKIMQIN